MHFDNKDKKKIILIIGAGRSGSTILGNILGGMPNIEHVGEFQRLWERGLLEDGVCGCGENIKKCEFWGNIINEHIKSPIDQLEKLVEIDRTLIKTRSLIWRVFNRKNYLEISAEYLNNIEKVFIKILENNRKLQAIVDGSKYPTYAEIIKRSKLFDVYILHLVRDPRAVAYSWSRSKYDPDKKTAFAKMSFFKSAVLSSVWNVLIEKMNKNYDNYYVVRYEDLVSSPIETLDQISAFTGCKNLSVLVRDDGRVMQAGSHTIAGNPNRFGEAYTNLKGDMEWKKNMPMYKKIVITLLSFPTVFKYGYLK